MCVETKTVPADRSLSHAARLRILSQPGEPLFYADWDRVMMIHFEVDPAALQREMPFGLDLRDGKAYVTLVAFTMRGLRPRFGGRLGAWLADPIATHEYLNVRTYARHNAEAGIYFLGEWFPNPFSVWLGPRTFGLPYRHGRCSYDHRHETGKVSGSVTDTRLGWVKYRGTLTPVFARCATGSLSEFLMERYTAFIDRAGKSRFFRIWHEPWLQTIAEMELPDVSLLEDVWPWFREAKLAGANYSPGASCVWMGWPHRIQPPRNQKSPKTGRVLSAFYEIP